MMVKVRDAEDREEASTNESDENIAEVTAGAEPVLLWPVVRKMPDGRTDCRHVLVHGDQSTESTGDNGAAPVSLLMRAN